MMVTLILIFGIFIVSLKFFFHILFYWLLLWKSILSLKFPWSKWAFGFAFPWAVFAFFSFFFEHLLHGLWDINSVFRLMNSNSHYSCTWITLCKRYCALFTHCSWDPQLLYSKKNIKNGSYNTIHTFKNYFTTIFSVLSKINCIQIELLPHKMCLSHGFFWKAHVCMAGGR